MNIPGLSMYLVPVCNSAWPVSILYVATLEQDFSEGHRCRQANKPEYEFYNGA